MTGLFLVAASPAAAARPCGDAVRRDWSDGSIDRSYPRRCYQEALQSMPEDLRIYSTAEDDIRRALLNAKPLRPLPRSRSAATGTPDRGRGMGARTAGGRPGEATPARQKRRAPAVHERRRIAAAAATSTVGEGPSLPLPLLLAFAVAALWGALALTSVAIRAARRRATRPDRSP